MIERSYLVKITNHTPEDRLPSSGELSWTIGSELGSDLGLVSIEVEDAPDAYYGPRCSCRVTHADDCDLRAHE